MHGGTLFPSADRRKSQGGGTEQRGKSGGLGNGGANFNASVLAYKRAEFRAVEIRNDEPVGLLRYRAYNYAGACAENIVQYGAKIRARVKLGIKHKVERVELGVFRQQDAGIRVNDQRINVERLGERNGSVGVGNLQEGKAVIYSPVKFPAEGFVGRADVD